MSFDLAVLHLDKPTTSAAVREIYLQLCDGNYSLVMPSEKIDAFYQELVARYPDINSYADDEIDNCPWTVDIDVSDGAVVMCIAWSRVNEVAGFVIQLAKKHNLTCFDPQADAVC